MTLGDVTLAKGTDYTVSYSSNKAIGTATVTVTGAGNYKGTVSANFKIVPAKVTLSSVTAQSKAFVAQWVVQSGVSGYQLQYATSSDFASGKKTVSFASDSTYKGKVTGLIKGTTYYVKVRAYKEVGGVKNYSSWSSVKSVTVK